MKYLHSLAVFSALAIVFIMFSGSFAQADERTSGRSVSSPKPANLWFFKEREWEPFKPRMWDSKHDHSAQWDGQDWDTSQWNEEWWTSKKAVMRLYNARILHNQYMRRNMPVLEVGPNYYKLSDHDQRRVLKLVAEHFDIFGQGYHIYHVRDWHSHEIIGKYTRQGAMFN